MQTISKTLRTMALALTLPLLAAAAHAQTTIDQAKALAGNVTPGDAPGYPITISKPGSYMLTSNLDVPFNVNAIIIDAENVVLDLNGFEIRSVGVCERIATSGWVYCSGVTSVPTQQQGAYSGVRVNRRYAVVRNGAIAGFHGHGVYSYAGSLSLDGLRVHQNHYHGVLAMGAGNSVTNSHLTLNRENGLYGVSVLIDGVVARENGEHGIEVSHGLVSRTMATQNRLQGLYGNGGPNPTSVRHSQFQFNKGASEVAGDLVSGGGNVANATVF
jgi:hypothetical protein